MINFPLVFKIGTLLLSILFYLVSLVLPCYYMHHDLEGIYGFVCLIFGWMVFFYDPVFIIPWFSNFLFLLCIPFAFFRISGYIVIPICLVAICMAIPAFFVTALPMNEVGGISAVTIDSGTYLWFISYITLLVSLCIPAKWQRRINSSLETIPDINEIP